MATSRSEDPETGLDLVVPPAASDAEAAAIAAAIDAHLAAEAAEAVTTVRDESDDRGAAGWADRRWAFAGRLAGLGRRRARPPDGAPTDPWTAAGRADRF